MNWFISVMKRFGDFNGRASRTEYWMFFLFCIIFSLLIGFTSGFVGHFIGDWFPALINLLFTLVTFVPSIAVAIRRMHDIGRSGWWILVPIVGFVFLCLPSNEGENEYGPVPSSTI